jgi:predicted nucleic acid-binding protein
LTESIRKLATIPGRIPATIYRPFDLDRWERDVNVRRRWFEFGVHESAALLDSFVRIVELPYDEAIWFRSIPIMSDERLRSHDAIHVATAREYGVPCIATTDEHFLRINDLDVRLIRDDAPARN